MQGGGAASGRLSTKSTWLYVASLCEIAIATDVLQTGWSDRRYLALEIPLALALVGAVASLLGPKGGMIATFGACTVLLLSRFGHTGALTWRDAFGTTLFILTGLVLASLAVSRREQEHRLVRQDRKLSEAVVREERRNLEKDEFLALVAHELRNPATVIIGAAQALENDRTPSEARPELVHDISLEAARLGQLIEDILLVARAEADDATATVHEPVRLEQVIPRAIEQFHRRQPNPVTTSLDSDLPLVSGSATQIERVLANLLSNAGKYSPPAKDITLRARRSEQHVEVDVLDQGPGIGSLTPDAVFHRSRSGDPSGETASYGLGLVISRRLVEANAGLIWARNRETGGLDVGFSLPAYGTDGDAGEME
jgi:two-component system sensor histidine kinase KdpD